ncbi:MAG: tetratricopeptide repeat protein [Chloroflexota bacterium]
MGIALANLAALLRHQDDLPSARLLMQRAHAIFEKHLGVNDPARHAVGRALHNLQ